MSDKKDFKNFYPVYSVDLSDQPQYISSTKSNVRGWPIVGALAVFPALRIFGECPSTSPISW
jgi:hypothetical protein